MNTRVASSLVTCVIVFSWFQSPVLAAMYNSQLYNGNGVAGAVGNGSLMMSNDVNTIQAKFTKGIGSFQLNMVIFIDSVPGGFTSTSGFLSDGSALEASITGAGATRSSTANFASGFQADYAIAFGIGPGSGLYKFVDDITGKHLELVRSSLNLNPTVTPNEPFYYFQFDWTDIGLPSQKTNFFKFESSYINSSSYRTLESFEGLTGTEGYSTINFTNYDTYGVRPVPENTNAALAMFGGIALIA